MHKTVIPKGDTQHWHYKNHLEACYCIAGAGILQNLETGEKHWIFPDTVYVLDNHDDHEFQAIEETILISVFNPPVTGGEVHDADGSYRKPLSQVVSEAEAFLGHEHMSPQAEEIKKIKKLAEDNGFTFAQVYDGLMTEEES